DEIASIFDVLHHHVKMRYQRNNSVMYRTEITQIATICRVLELKIKGFTPPILNVFHVLESDRGRPLRDFASQLADHDLIEEFEQVLSTDRPREHPVRLPGGGWAIMRALPYRTLEGAIDGVVV